jgi:hypothetical protein
MQLSERTITVSRMYPAEALARRRNPPSLRAREGYVRVIVSRDYKRTLNTSKSRRDLAGVDPAAPGALFGIAASTNAPTAALKSAALTRLSSVPPAVHGT